MNYEQKYKEILAKARTFYKRWDGVDVYNSSLAISELKEIFPELKESEDERIKKAIHIYLDWLDGRKDYAPKGEYSIRDMIAWLEKQSDKPQGKSVLKSWKDMRFEVYQQASGNRHESNYSDDATKMFSLNDIDEIFERIAESHEEKPVDKVEPKFEVGDWVVNKFDDLWHIDSFDKKNYQVSDGKGNYNYFSILHQDEMRFWTIKDAKKGDVLAEDSCIFIIQKFDGINASAKTYCTLFDDDDFDSGSTLYFDIDSTKPATKEQRDILFAKMKEAGYEWNTDKKELIKL